MEMNPIEQLQTFIKRGGTPEQLVTQLINKNPQLKNVVDMVQRGDKTEVETFARNMFKEQGRDFDQEFKTFMNYFK